MNTATGTAQEKRGPVKLIYEYFRCEGQTSTEFAHEYRQLSETDRVELASAVAQDLGLSRNDLRFELVAY